MNTTDTVSSEIIENTRKEGARIESEVLRRLADVTQVHAASCMGVSASTISRMTEDIGRVAQLLASVGLKVADANSMVVDSAEMEALESMAFKYLDQRRKNRSEA